MHLWFIITSSDLNSVSLQCTGSFGEGHYLVCIHDQINMCFNSDEQKQKP